MAPHRIKFITNKSQVYRIQDITAIININIISRNGSNRLTITLAIIHLLNYKVLWGVNKNYSRPETAAAAASAFVQVFQLALRLSLFPGRIFRFLRTIIHKVFTSS